MPTSQVDNLEYLQSTTSTYDTCQLSFNFQVLTGVWQVEVEIDTMDRGGNFLGTLTMPGSNRPFNLGPALLEAGLAKLHPSFDPDRVRGGAELAAAQAHAQTRKLKV